QLSHFLKYAIGFHLRVVFGYAGNFSDFTERPVFHEAQFDQLQFILREPSEDPWKLRLEFADMFIAEHFLIQHFCMRVFKNNPSRPFCSPEEFVAFIDGDPEQPRRKRESAWLILMQLLQCFQEYLRCDICGYFLVTHPMERKEKYPFVVFLIDASEGFWVAFR